ncbi:MAG: NAD-dependent deacylase [Parasphingorhabdus sp.]|uniref:NAD-dependent deacylase n=1 Tax=Parasphingorhabdus sp. TaxID=2709688 RepID=UPI0030014518
MREINNIVILTGAGISAESGVATFRGPDGLWKGHRVEDVATPEAFQRHPILVQKFYDERRAKLQGVQPNPAHLALAQLDAAWGGDLLLVTQNVDDLHNRAGSKRLLHMHGELLSGLCLACGERSPVAGNLSDGPVCPHCRQSAMRPDIVWFGEMPYQMDRIESALSQCDLFVSIGTSGAVYPAAGFVRSARHYGALTLEMNLDPSDGSLYFNESRMGKAGELVPAWVDDILSSGTRFCDVMLKR